MRIKDQSYDLDQKHLILEIEGQPTNVCNLFRSHGEGILMAGHTYLHGENQMERVLSELGVSFLDYEGDIVQMTIHIDSGLARSIFFVKRHEQVAFISYFMGEGSLTDDTLAEAMV